MRIGSVRPLWLGVKDSEWTAPVWPLRIGRVRTGNESSGRSGRYDLELRDRNGQEWQRMIGRGNADMERQCGVCSDAIR